MNNSVSVLRKRRFGSPKKIGCKKFGLSAEFGLRRLVPRDCVHHQEVPANPRDFLRHRIARDFRSLPRQGPVSVVGPAILRGNSWRVSPKVSGRKFPFPRLLFATCPPRPISNGPWGFEPRHLTRFGWDGSAGRRKTKEQGWIVRYACAGAWSPRV